MSEPVILHTASARETREVGRCVAASLRGGERIGLSGELGAGKTCFVRGLAEGLDIPPDQVRSPSFPIIVPYEGGRVTLYHIDLFRVSGGDFDGLGLREYLYGADVCAVEWFERLGDPLEDFLEVVLTFVGPESRRLMAVGHGLGYDAMIDALRARERS